MLMDAKVEDGVVFVEDILGAVAMVDIKVDDEHPLEAMAVLEVPSRHGYIVKHTKPHAPSLRGMVPRRTDQGKGRRRPSCHHLVTAGDPRPGRQRSGFPGGPRDYRVPRAQTRISIRPDSLNLLLD